MLFRLIGSTFCAVSLLSTASANLNDKKFTDSNIDFYVGMTSHEKDVKVSGTNVNGVFRVSWGAVPEYQGDTWDQVTIVQLQVACDDMDLTFTPPSFPLSPTYSKTIRFASTHFNDDSTISFTIKGKFSLVDNTPGGMSGKQVEFTHVATLKAHNKLEAFGTKNSVPVSLSNSIAKIAGFKFSSSHTVTPGMLDDPWRTEAQLEADLAASTFTFFSTHANLSLYEDSDGGTSDSHRITPIENYGYLFTNRPSSVPGMNIAVMYSCATLDDTSYPWPMAFGVVGLLADYVDKAYAGFDDLLPSGWDGPSGQEVSLYDHAFTFIEEFGSGKTIQQAATKANTDWGPPGNLLIRGDGYSRIKYVYLNASERSGLSEGEENKWYWVF